MESGRFVATDVSYPVDSYPKLRWFAPNAKMIRIQSLDDSYPTAFLIIKTFLIISLSKQSKRNIYINQKDSLPTRELDQIITTAHFLCLDSWRVSGADTKGGETYH